MRPWHEVEEDFLESDYQAVRERQMKELEEEDDLLSKVPVRFVRIVLAIGRFTNFPTEICVQSSIRSPTNLSDNREFTVSRKAPGL